MKKNKLGIFLIGIIVIALVIGLAIFIKKSNVSKNTSANVNSEVSKVEEIEKDNQIGQAYNDEKTMEMKEQEEKEKTEQEAKEKAEKEKAEKEAKEKAEKEKEEQEAKEKAAREKAEQEAREKAAKEKAEQEAREKAAKEKAEQEAKEKAAKENNTKVTKSQNNTSSKAEYYIKVNIKANVVNIYKKDEKGKYTIPFKAMVCSTGKATPAAGNVYTMPGKQWDRYPWGTMVGGVYAQYYTRIVGNILFHSVPYTKEKKSCLEYWEYDKLGTKASAGCIRLTVKDAKWIYNNCPVGTKVEFYSDSNPGPFGKPTAQKISNESKNVRGWDPTDPDPNNPWKNYKSKNNN